jgi:hypothetical protein
MKNSIKIPDSITVSSCVVLVTKVPRRRWGPDPQRRSQPPLIQRQEQNPQHRSSRSPREDGAVRRSPQAYLLGPLTYRAATRGLIEGLIGVLPKETPYLRCGGDDKLDRSPFVLPRQDPAKTGSFILPKDTPYLRCGAGVGTMSLTGMERTL